MNEVLRLDRGEWPEPWERALSKANAINPILASRLQREDLNGYNPPLVSDPYSNPQITSGASGQLAAALSFDTGRISVGMIGLLVLGAAGFYIWTRRHQA